MYCPRIGNYADMVPSYSVAIAALWILVLHGLVWVGFYLYWGEKY